MTFEVFEALLLLQALPMLCFAFFVLGVVYVTMQCGQEELRYERRIAKLQAKTTRPSRSWRSCGPR